MRQLTIDSEHFHNKDEKLFLNKKCSLCNHCPCFSMGEETDDVCNLGYEIHFIWTIETPSNITFSENCKLKIVKYDKKTFIPEKIMFKEAT